MQGITALFNGQLVVCDGGRNGIYNVDPMAVPVNVTTNAGFNGTGDFITNSGDIASVSQAKFNHPTAIVEAGDGTLIVSDYNNNRLKVIANGAVTNLEGVTRKYWHGSFPGWLDGAVNVPDSNPVNAESRLPYGLAFGPDGTVYVSEDFYHTIRKVTGAAFGLPPPPPPQVPAPQIGYVSIPSTSVPNPFTSVFTPVTGTFIFNNDAPIIIESSPGTQTFYTFSNTPTLGLVPQPTASSFSASPGYADGELPSQVSLQAVAGTAPFVAIKAISEKNDGSPNSPVVQALFEYIVANPTINGVNAAQFTVTDITSNSLIYYTLDGSTPTNAAPSLGPITNGTTLSIASISNILFTARGFRANYQSSSAVSTFFSTNNFNPNSISFGFASGEASSAFIASPGQTFYAPVTLTVLPSTTIDSLQFNLIVTNGGPNPGPAVASGAFGFQSFLEKPIPGTSPTEYTNIPPAEFDGLSGFQSLVFTNLSLDLLGVGWIERAGATNLYDTLTQTLISFSQVHDVQFLSSGGQVEVGGYQFQVPLNAPPNSTYQIQIGRPTATSDGIGADVFIATPTNGSLAAGSINAIKVVTVGQFKYIAGDVTPFRWFNAGDFGKGFLNNADVEQVFQSAIYSVNTPPPGSDFFDGMDSAGFTYIDNGNGYLEKNTFANPSVLFNGNDTTINQIAFGDGILDVADVYVTYRRSLDPSLVFFQRFWTNGVKVAQITANVAPHIVKKPNVQPRIQNTSTNSPQVNFGATNIIVTAGQTAHIPITAQIFGGYPMRVLMLNLSVVPLDGSPQLTTGISFTPSAAIGAPTFPSESTGPGNYAAAWLNSAITGLSNNAVIGTLTVVIPPSATSLSAYDIHFDHASGSPNGLVSFPNQKFTGLISLINRTNSSYGDGIPDSWRLRWFGTTNNDLTLSNADACGDGISNWKKYVAGVDPTIPYAFPQVNSKSTIPKGFTAAIHWPSVSGKQYVILRAPALFNSTWSVLNTNTGTGGDMEYDDNSNGQYKFYRVLILP